MSEPSAPSTIQPLTWPPTGEPPAGHLVTPLHAAIVIGSMLLGGVITLITGNVLYLVVIGVVGLAVWTIVSRAERAPTVRHIRRLLLARPPCLDVWGDDSHRRELAQILCERTAQEMKWPNDHFIPADLFALVYFEVSGIDGLESFTVCRELETKTRHKIDWKVLKEKFPDGNSTLGDLLDAVMQPEAISTPK